MRLRPHKRWDDEGVASTVGTIMALMVFLAFLSMFTSQYVPVWMEENEASHMSEVYGQFAALKQAVDMQVLAGAIQGTSPIEMFSPVKLGANGIPMFAAPTAGALSINRGGSYNNISFSFSTGTTVTNFTTTSGGTIKLYAGNRYFIPQEVAYENDALILKQSDGQYMKATPQFTVTPSGGMYQISFTQMDLRGDDINYIGFGTRGIKTSMRSATTTTFTNLTGDIASGARHQWLYINQTTWYEKAWYASFNQTLSTAGLSWGTDYMITSTIRPNTDPIDDFYQISIRIDPSLISRLSLTVANVEVSTAEMGAV
jgi:hypothetical protein